jgi:hypothetical protein
MQLCSSVSVYTIDSKNHVKNDHNIIIPFCGIADPLQPPPKRWKAALGKASREQD